MAIPFVVYAVGTTKVFEPFLNQAHTSLWPARAWFLRIVFVRTPVRMCVCPPPRLLITSGVM